MSTEIKHSVSYTKRISNLYKENIVCVKTPSPCFLGEGVFLNNTKQSATCIATIPRATKRPTIAR